MTSKLRKRKFTADEKGDLNKSNGKAQMNSKKKSSKTIVYLLVLMVVLTWAVAATSYFGVINYKALVASAHSTSISFSSPRLSSYISHFSRSKYQAIRHPFRTMGNWMIKLDQFISGLLSDEGLEETDQPHVITKDEKEIKDAPTSESVDDHTSEEAKKSVSKEESENIKKSASETSNLGGKKAKQTDKETNNATKRQSSDQVRHEKKKGKSGTASEFDSEHDKTILKELTKGEGLLKKKKAKEASAFFNQLVRSHPKSPRAMYGKARSLLLSAAEERSNKLLQEGIDALSKVVTMSQCPLPLVKKAAMVKVDKLLFFGRMKEALLTAQDLHKKLPRDVQVINKLGVVFLYLGKNTAAKSVYRKALAIDPNDGFALVHYGFVVKSEGDWIEGARYLQRGIESGQEGTQEGKFYMHLGDALLRTNRSDQAKEVYKVGADKGFFRSVYQRSLYNVDHLQSHPFWTAEEAKATTYVKIFEKNWKMIRDEALSNMDADKGLFLPEEESLKNTGDWKQLTLYARGQKQKDCKRLPKTCALIEKMPNAIGCKRGQIKFSIMAPGTHVWAHTGPTNCRLRMHLGLVIPRTGKGAKLRCADQYKTWEEGKVLIFDDSFEHEVWQYADTYRLILIVDVWHPDLTEQEKRTLSPI